MAFCFSDDDQSAIRAAFRASGYPESVFWGNLAGHLHEWGWKDAVFPDDGQGYPAFKELMVSACKGNEETIDINSALAIVPLYASGVDIPKIERRWYDSKSGTWTLVYGPSESDITQESRLFQILTEKAFSA